MRQIKDSLFTGILLFLVLMSGGACLVYGQQPVPVTSASHATASGINSVRAQYGLPALAYDITMEQWAGINNQHQRARGMGHYVVAPARRQNAAYNYADAGSVIRAWMASAGHRDAILDPTITVIGVAWDGVYWTMNAR